MATGGVMAKRAALRGRTTIAIGLAAFLVVTTSVVFPARSWQRRRATTVRTGFPAG
jgi:hypothetical protein